MSYIRTASLPGAATTSVGITGQKSTTRLASIDIFRGLTMAAMIFVNDLASVKGLPWWTYHMPGRSNGMTYVDVVFPVFLFIVGLALPLAVSARLKRDGSELHLWGHILLRTFSLEVLGLILANASKGDPSRMGIPSHWWAFCCLVCAFLIWNAYPRNPAFRGKARLLRTVGVLALCALLILFRRVTRTGQVAWLDTSYWEILGIIGWAYLSACLLYIPTRSWRWAPLASFALLLVWNVVTTQGFGKPLTSLPPYRWPFGAGSACMIVMAGVVTQQIFSSSAARLRIQLASAFAAVSFLLGWLLSPLGISKIHATPTWGLYSIGISLVIYVCLYWLCDVERKQDWFAFIRPAGSNTLTTYLVPDLYYFAVLGTALDAPFALGAPGVLRAVVFTVVMLGLAALLTRCKVQLQL